MRAWAGDWQGRTGTYTDRQGRTRTGTEDETYVSADRFRIHGLSVRNRNAGLGAPIVIVGDKKLGTEFIPEGSAATVFLRLEGGLQDMEADGLLGQVEIYSAFMRDHIDVAGHKIPLETDLTTHIVYALNNPIYWQLQKLLFRLGQAPFKPGIYPAQPYQAGKVPLLFVHGTMSSPVWWAEMWNTLQGDPVLRTKYQFWFYLYDSAKPVAQSAAHLRESIETMAPDNPAMLALAEIPVTPPIKAHLIISVKGDAVPPDGDDGVVKYTSAHIEGVESELVVRSKHSCQGKPATIEEVRRILLLHLQQLAPK